MPVLMVDTNVVIYAMGQAKPKGPVSLRTMLTASQDLMRRLERVSISVVTLMEVRRGLRPKELELPPVASLFQRLHVYAADAAAGERAVELLAAKNVSEKVCSKCLSSKNDHPYGQCGRTVSSQQRLNDALIAATTDVCSDECTLYAFDAGVLAFAPHVRSCKIERPPNSWGEMFEEAFGQSITGSSGDREEPPPGSKPERRGPAK